MLLLRIKGNVLLIKYILKNHFGICQNTKIKNMKKLILCLMIGFLCYTSVLCQPYFNKTYGQPNHDLGVKILKDSDSTFVLLGSSFGQIYFLKVNRQGDTLWTKRHGTNYFEYSSDVVKTNDGNYLIISQNTGQEVGGITKVNTHGDTIWTKFYADSAGYPASIAKKNENFIVLGRENCITVNGNDTIQDNDISITEYDSLGNTLWQKYYGNPIDTDNAGQLIITQDGNYVVTGSTYIWSYGTLFYLFKTNQQGDTLWTKTLFESSSMKGVRLVENSSKELVVIGYKYVSGEDHNMVFLKFDSLGNKLWEKDYDFGYKEYGTEIISASAGGYYALGYVNYNTTAGNMITDIILLRLNENGDALWTKTFQTSGEEIALSILEIDNNNFAILGTMYSSVIPKSEVYLIICDSLGNYDNTLGIENTSLNIPSNKCIIYPNPSNAFSSVKLISTDKPIESIEIINPLGQQIYQLTGIKKREIPIETSFLEGLYFIKVYDTDNQLEILKMIKE